MEYWRSYIGDGILVIWRYLDIGYWRYFDIGYRILKIGYWRFGNIWRLDIGDIGNVEIWIFEIQRFAKNIHFPYVICTICNDECRKCTFSQWNINIFTDLGRPKRPRQGPGKAPARRSQAGGKLPASCRQDRLLGAENVDFILVFVLFEAPGWGQVTSINPYPILKKPQGPHSAKHCLGNNSGLGPLVKCFIFFS